MEIINTNTCSQIIGTKNAGCRILDARPMCGRPARGIALARSPADSYITWQWHLVDDQPFYYWGHYFGADRCKATNDFEKRAANSLEEVG